MRLANSTINFNTMLYLIGNKKYIKVGYTANYNTFAERMSAYKTHNPDCRLIGLKAGTLEDEKHYHKLLADKKLPDRKEWFYYDADIIGDFETDEDRTLALFLLDVDSTVVDEIDDTEIITMITGIICNDKLIDVIVTYASAYLVIRSSNLKRTLLELNTDEIKPFYTDYNKNNEMYSGAIIHNNIIYTYRGKYGESSGIIRDYKDDTPLYQLIEPYI